MKDAGTNRGRLHFSIVTTRVSIYQGGHQDRVCKIGVGGGNLNKICVTSGQKGEVK